MELCVGAKVLSSADANEAALVERCRRQDIQAFGKIVDAYQNRVFGFVRRMVVDTEDSADITQETFIRAFQSFSRFDGRSSLRTWLFRIAHNLCVDRARKVGRAPAELRIEAVTEDEEQLHIPDSRWSPETLAMDAELAEAIEAAIASMSEKLRSVLLLHDREDMQYEEIAQALQLPIGTVKSRLFLARAHLQKALTPYLKPEVNSND